MVKVVMEGDGGERRGDSGGKDGIGGGGVMMTEVVVEVIIV